MDKTESDAVAAVKSSDTAAADELGAPLFFELSLADVAVGQSPMAVRVRARAGAQDQEVLCRGQE